MFFCSPERALKSPIGDLNSRPRSLISLRARKVSLRLGLVSALVVAAGMSGAFAGSVGFLNNVFFTVAEEEFTDCAPNSSFLLSQSVDSSGTVQIDGVTVDGISSACDGEVVAVVIYNSSSTILDEIIWTLALTDGDTGFSLVADGTTTNSSNSSSGGVSTNYPASQTDPEGLAANLVASDVASVDFLHLDTSRAARE